MYLITFMLPNYYYYFLVWITLVPCIWVLTIGEKCSEQSFGGLLIGNQLQLLVFPSSICGWVILSYTDIHVMCHFYFKVFVYFILSRFSLYLLQQRGLHSRTKKAMEFIAKGFSALKEIDRVIDHCEIGDKRLISGLTVISFLNELWDNMSSFSFSVTLFFVLQYFSVTKNWTVGIGGLLGLMDCAIMGTSF